MRPATWIAFLCGSLTGGAIVALGPEFASSPVVAPQGIVDEPVRVVEGTSDSSGNGKIVKSDVREAAALERGTVESQGSAATVPRPVERKPRSVEEIQAAIRAAIGSGDPDVRIDRMLVELLESGPEGPQRVVDLFVDPGLRPDEFSRAFGLVLAGIDDPRIAPAAQRWLEKNLDEGDDDWTYTQSFLRLIAAKGSGTELGSLLATLDRPGQAGHHAAEAVVLLASRGVDPVPYLEKFRDLASSDRTRHNAQTLAAALAEWNDPRVEDRLWEFARDPGIGTGVVGDALAALARRNGDAAFDRFQRELAQAPSERRIEVIPALFGYAQSGDGNTEAGRGRFENEVLRLLEGDVAVAVACAGHLRGVARAATPSLLQAIERLRATSLAPDQREIVDDAWRTLRKRSK